MNKSGGVKIQIGLAENAQDKIASCCCLWWVFHCMLSNWVDFLIGQKPVGLLGISVGKGQSLIGPCATLQTFTFSLGR